MNALITAPGAYPDVSIEDYHRNANLLPAPSLSASGMKSLLTASPFHFWASSPMNPEPPEEDSAPHLNVGKAAHDMLLLSDRWPDHYHVLPEGYRSSATKKFADAIEEEKEAREAGKVILRHQDALVVERVASAIGLHDLASVALSSGQPETTLVWQDKETGVWLRCRPDWLPNSVVNGGAVRVVSDLKFMAPTNCSPRGFETAIWRFMYHVAAAHYFDGIAQIYGDRPTHWLHIVVEKEFPFSVSLYPLPEGDIARGRGQARIAIRRFADCLSSGKWPGWADEPTPVGLPGFARKIIDEYGTAQDASLLSAA